MEAQKGISKTVAASKSTTEGVDVRAAKSTKSVSEGISTKSVTQVQSTAAVESEPDPEAQPERPPSTRKRRRRRRRRERPPEAFKPDYDIPGITKITLTPSVQKMMGIVVGENVTAEKPWRSLKKELFEDDLELHEETSIFLDLKQEILEYPREDLLVGYVPDESREYDEFYVCLTETANDAVTGIIAKIEELQEARLQNTIFKTIKPWASLGSEDVVTDGIIKNFRPLLEVEVETEYPIMASKVQFRFRRVDAVRDGYAELLVTRYPITNVYKKRIDAEVQVAPSVMSNEAQTNCTYPKNAWTQYEYECVMDEHPSEDYKKSIKEFITEQMDDIYDHIYVNEYIDLYKDDYKNLITDEKYIKPPEVVHCKEYMSFTNITVCKNKMISSAAWHPMWTGVVAIAYADAAQNTFVPQRRDTDQVYRAIYVPNPVLMWSFVDGLNAKLYLEANREVLSLSFCPYDENILIGGCLNGQVIIWDLKNKLRNVEAEEVLTTAQHRYRTIMNSLMGWFKNTRDLSVVRPTAVSDLEYSHKASVTDIHWLSPYWEVSRTGQFKEIEEDREDTSLQFITSSLDGTVMFWDLKAKPTLHAGGFRPQRKSRRLKQRPSALMLDVSPYKQLNRIFKPHYKVNIKIANENRNLPLSSFNIDFTTVNYTEVDPIPSRKFNINERLYYEPIIHKPEKALKSQFQAGTVEGDYLLIKWEGFEFNQGDVVNSEICKIINYVKFHDGPIHCISRSQAYPDVALTVGGKIFAIWKDGFNHKPILWRRSNHRYTHGSWNTYRPSMFRLTRADGNIEAWSLLLRSDTPTGDQNISGQPLTGSHTHDIKMTRNVLGVCDYNGSFRIFFIPKSLESYHKTELDLLVNLFEREQQRKTAFELWQTQWNSKHASWIQQKKIDAEIEKQRLMEEEEQERVRLEEEQARLEKEAAKMDTQKNRPPPGEFLQWAKDQWIKKEQDRMSKILMEKKSLDRELLEKQQEPLQVRAEEEHKKKQKQMERLGDSQKIFEETVAMLFPDAVEKKPPPPPDPYGGEDAILTRKTYYSDYIESIPVADEYVLANPHRYFFDWKNVLYTGRARRKVLDEVHGMVSHKIRQVEYKRIRREEEEEAKRAAAYVAPLVMQTSIGSIDYDMMLGDDAGSEQGDEVENEEEEA